MDQANKIKDQSKDRKYWVGVPQIVWAKAKDPFELTLWLVIKMIAGEEGECYLSTPDLATAAMMSTGKASQCRRSLIDSRLLEGEIRKDPGYPQPVWHLTIPDLWPENVAWRQENQGLKKRIEAKREQRKEPSPGERGLSPGEKGLSPGETKKNHVEEQEEEPHGADAPSEPAGEELVDEYFGPRKTPKQKPIESTGDWASRLGDSPHLTWGAESQELQHQKERFGPNAEPVLRLGYELDKRFGLRPTWGSKRRIKTWMSGLHACLLAADSFGFDLVIEVTKRMREENLTIKDPYSIEGMVASAAAEKRSGGGSGVFMRVLA